jgi:benzodiazapine receptor
MNAGSHGGPAPFQLRLVRGAMARHLAVGPVMKAAEQPLLRRELGFAAIALGAAAGALIVGQLATFPNLAPWYAGLAKPSFNPPNWVFAPVWTVLYLLMAFAVWRVLRLPERSWARRLALSLFFLQLALNVAWSFMFFSAHSPLLGMLNIIPQWILIVATATIFYRLDRIAFWCLQPLLVWVAFAAVLNFTILKLNA